LPRNADDRLACRGDFSDPYPICQSEYRRVLEEVSENSAGNAAPPETARRDVRSESGKGWKTGAKTFGWLVAVFLLSSAQDGAIGRRGAENGASRRLRDIAANASGLTLAAPWLQAFVSVWVSPQLEARIAGLDSGG